MDTKRSIWLVVCGCAVCAVLFLLLSFPLRSAVFALTHDAFVATLAQVAAVGAGYYLYLEGFAGYQMLSRTHDEQVAYLEILKQRFR